MRWAERLCTTTPILHAEAGTGDWREALANLITTAIQHGAGTLTWPASILLAGS
ncbi:MAG: hypothetical protein IPG92_10400 [Flavobacteriales bacterium]|nr:hypothetical protein [Flavobacteriales bacterium]